MKKLLLSVSFILPCTRLCFGGIFDGPSLPFTKPEMVFSVGYGLPYPIYNTIGPVSGLSVGWLGPFQAKFEEQLTSYAGIGLCLNYFTSDFNWNNNTPYQFRLKIKTFSALVRANFHFIRTEKTDVYWGVGLGLRQNNWYFSSNDPASPSSVTPTEIPYGAEVTIGMRYYVTPQFAFYAEAGAAKSAVQAGLTAKF